MSPRTSKQFSEMRESARKRIMEAALELFANKGYHSTSISQIAKEAAISKGLMYNYFESKEALLKEVIFEGVDTITDSFDPNRDGILTKDELIHFIRESFKLVREHTTYWKLYFSLLTQAGIMGIFSDDLAPRMQRLFGMLTQFFYSQNYETPELEMRFFGSLLDGVAINFVMDPENFPLNEIENKIIEMYK
ncbi:MAG TPA: TetR/AcrR family transcriptional regulator [Tenuifilaceae bacterium]|nr:TetR/AcrR family transcriptional regulator [Tenuifilaceae bacterium]